AAVAKPAQQPSKPVQAPAPVKPAEIEEELVGAGLERFVPRFVAAGITTFAQLSQLRESEFAGLGVVTPLHKKTLATLIATLDSDGPEASDVDSHLASAGLERYQNAFKSAGVRTTAQLTDLEPSQYGKYGVIIPAHKKLLATLILSLQAEAENDDYDELARPTSSSVPSSRASGSFSSSSSSRGADLFGGPQKTAPAPASAASAPRQRPQSSWHPSPAITSVDSPEIPPGDIPEVVRDLRNDSSDTDWLLLEAKGSSVVFQASGTGGFHEFIDNISDSKIQYGLLRLIQGDQESRRVKFVFVRWVGPGCSGILKAKANTLKSTVVAMLGQYHVEIFAEDESELTLERITEKLKAAAGADYDQGNKGGYTSSAGSLKSRALDNYRSKERDGTLGKIVYETSALPSTTPCDISNRPFVAPSSEARSNIRGY
ncbi:MAG: hypothetical protein Q8P67_11210, partial [archaeon]|nr:hypothetical protein [archaeon]